MEDIRGSGIFGKSKIHPKTEPNGGPLVRLSPAKSAFARLFVEKIYF